MFLNFDIVLADNRGGKVAPILPGDWILEHVLDDLTACYGRVDAGVSLEFLSIVLHRRTDFEGVPGVIDRAVLAHHTGF